MNRVFRIAGAYRVPDGTLVAPFLNPKDSKSDLLWGLFEGLSIAAGEIEPHTQSKIHVLPFVTQITFTLEGRLTIMMKDVGEGPYRLEPGPCEAVLTQAGTFFQLINPHDQPCKALYIVSPAYLFEAGADDTIVYDDAITLDYSWEQLAALNWQPPELGRNRVLAMKRRQSAQRLATRKQQL